MGKEQKSRLKVRNREKKEASQVPAPHPNRKLCQRGGHPRGLPRLLPAPDPFPIPIPIPIPAHIAALSRLTAVWCPVPRARRPPPPHPPCRPRAGPPRPPPWRSGGPGAGHEKSPARGCSLPLFPFFKAAFRPAAGSSLPCVIILPVWDSVPSVGLSSGAAQCPTAPVSSF